MRYMGSVFTITVQCIIYTDRHGYGGMEFLSCFLCNHPAWAKKWSLDLIFVTIPFALILKEMEHKMEGIALKKSAGFELNP